MQWGTIVYRRARPEDYPSIIRLQAADYIDNLSEEQRKEGFLSDKFTLEQIAAIGADLGIAIVADGDEVAGSLCAFRREFDHDSPVVAKMLESYDRACFEDKPLSAFNSYIYGPVCIAREYRRRGLLRGLYEFQKKRSDRSVRSRRCLGFARQSSFHGGTYPWVGNDRSGRLRGKRQTIHDPGVPHLNMRARNVVPACGFLSALIESPQSLSLHTWRR
jgi:hypothetical protein